MRGIEASRHRGIVLMALAAALAGCRGERTDNRPRQFFPDMDDQPKYKAQGESTFFADGRTMREPVAGTVAFGERPFVERVGGVDFTRRAGYLREDARVFTGKERVVDAEGKAARDASGAVREVYVERTPVEELLGVKAGSARFAAEYERFMALGEKKFNIYCVVCHGMTGDGQGTVGVRWSYPLPTWHAEQYLRGGEKGSDGFVFHTIRHGVPNVGESVPYPLKMQGYASKMSEYETWAIVEYYRALQKAGGSSLDVAPETQRQDLEKRKPAAAPPEPPPQARVGGEAASRKEGSS
jgi:cytochrome c553